MSEHDHNTGKDHANKGWQPSAPDPSKTWQQNNDYQTGFVQEQQRQEQQRQERQRQGK